MYPSAPLMHHLCDGRIDDMRRAADAHRRRGDTRHPRVRAITRPLGRLLSH